VTPSTTPAAVDAVIVDYNGVIGRQPTHTMWQHLTAIAGWPTDQVDYFQRAFWNARDGYDAGTITDHEFWTTVLGTEPTRERLRELRAADTAMWTGTDDRVLAALHRARRAGVPVVLLSNAPHSLADALDATTWRRRLMTEAVYSARIGICKPDPAAYERALAATGTSPERVLFVDDHLDNCHTARELRMQAHHFTGSTTALTMLLPTVGVNTPPPTRACSALAPPTDQEPYVT
jgi:putative hydrolase of the HAD superfamily